MSSAYNLIKDHVQTDTVTIYTIISVFLKDYQHTEGLWFQITKCLACLMVQILVPIFILYDSLYESYHIRNLTFCPDTGTWTDRVVSSLLTFYLLFYYLNGLSPYSYKIFEYFNFGYKDTIHVHRLSSILDLLTNHEIDEYLSKGMFILGIIVKLLCLCLTTITNIIVVFETKGSIDISFSFMALSYLYELSENIIDDEIKQRAVHYIEKRNSIISESISSPKRTTFMKSFDRFSAFIGGLFLFFIIPLLVTGTLILNFLAIVFVPLCHP